MATTRAEVRDFFKARPQWDGPDRFGHFKMQRTTEDGTRRKYRMKLQKLSMRLEVLIEHQDGTRSWHRLMSGYYKNVNLTADGKVEGLK